MITENFKMFTWVGGRCTDINTAMCIIVENDDGVEEVRELLKNNGEDYHSVYCPGIYWWDEELNNGYRRFAESEIQMFAKVFAAL